MNPKLEQIRNLRDQSKSIREIAGYLNCSPGSISGLMARNRDIFPITDPRMSDLRKSQNRPNSNKLRQLFNDALKAHPIPKPKGEAAAYDQSRMQYAVIFADLPNHCCKWPVTSHEKGLPNLFCAAPKVGKNYCCEHSARERRVS